MTRDMLLSLLASFQQVRAMTGIDSADTTRAALASIIDGALDAMDANGNERADVRDAGDTAFFARLDALRRDAVPF